MECLAPVAIYETRSGVRHPALLQIPLHHLHTPWSQTAWRRWRGIRVQQSLSTYCTLAHNSFLERCCCDDASFAAVVGTALINRHKLFTLVWHVMVWRNGRSDGTLSMLFCGGYAYHSASRCSLPPATIVFVGEWLIRCSRRRKLPEPVLLYCSLGRNFSQHVLELQCGT